MSRTQSRERRKRRHPLALALTWAIATALALPATPAGAAGEPAIPESLKTWIPWVLEAHPDLGCPLVAGERVCWWPGRLLLELEDQGGRFELLVRADRDLDIVLPGDATSFPQEVQLDGRSALLRRQGDVPRMAVPRGDHRISGRFRWLRLPESLAIPAEFALIDLRLRGQAVPLPHREADGMLWLAARQGEENAEDGLSIEVFRRIADGVPVLLETRLQLRVAGQAREIALGQPLPAAFEPIELVSDLPARLGADGVLRVQLRPGNWQVRLLARSRDAVTELSSEPRPAPWPAEEIWVFAADPMVRAVRVEGAPGIDPQRTSLPDAWRALPAFQVAGGEGLRFAELRRGEPQPPPDEVTVARTLWLSLAGDRFTVSDRLQGTLNVGGRLEALAPATLGRAELMEADGQRRDQVITRTPGGDATGVEVRAGRLDLTADALYPRQGALPAVGWNRDASALSATLHLPPGWSLLAAPGADATSGAWVDRWNLLDFFLLLIVVLSLAKLDGWKMGALALVALVLAWQERYVLPLVWLLLALLILRGLELLRPAGRGRLFLRALVTVALVATLLLCVRWQWRTGRFPQLDTPAGSYFGGVDLYAEGNLAPGAPPPTPRQNDASKAIDELSQAESSPEESGGSYQPQRLQKRAKQIDPNAVVQTGPGLPGWRWQTLTLSWQGPVKADHPLRLLLISPGQELVLAILRILGLLCLAAVAIDWRRWRPWRADPTAKADDGEEPASPTFPPAGSILAVLLLAIGLSALPARAQVPPSEPAAARPALLDELERRLTRPPACAPDCLEVARLDLQANAREVRLTAELHAAAATAWSLPGPFAAFQPREVLLDGKSATALRLQADGFLALRLEPGVHRVTVSGPARDSLSLQFPLPPRVMTWQGEGFTLDGWREDAPPPSLVRIDRVLPADGAAEDGPGGAIELRPWLELVRRLDIGLPWLVHYELRRLGPATGAVLLRVPLLEGEAVTTAGVPVTAGAAQVTLEPGETLREWTSTLAERGELRLTSPIDRPWLERWELLCSPVWHCAAEGLTPVRHMAEGEWRPEWRPWPGEKLLLRFARPEGAPGQTLTIDTATLRLEPGRRLLEGTLDLDLRASRGGEQTLTLPAGAELLGFTLDLQPMPAQNVDGKVVYTVEPGAHRVSARWRQDFSAGVFQRAPALRLPAPAANAEIRIAVPEHRWLLATGGPDWGPVVLFWQDVVALLLAALALGRWAPTPLRTLDWFLLGLGLTQVPFAAAVIVVVFLCLLGLAQRPRAAWRHDLWQLALLGLGLIALGTLYATIHSGLLLAPDMQVAGAGSSSSELRWYAERVADDLPRPWLVWLPLFFYRLFMLAWALWLASRCLRWLPWIWRRFHLRESFFLLPASWRRRREAAAAARPVL